METIFSGDSKAAKKGRKWLAGILEQSVVEVTFTKKDGTERVMYCTLDEECLPELEMVTIVDKDQLKRDTLAVYDVDADGWRSFRWDSIKAVKVIVESVDA
jgi:hypothetical protein